jgi:putative endonuclease
MSRPNTGAKRRAEAAGRRGEMLAGLILSLKGFTIIARRFKAPGGEIDLVGKRGRLLIFVEVKARASLDDALDAVGYANQRRVSDAASMFLAHHPRLAHCDMRYDLIAVSGWRWRHIKSAWLDDD